MMWHWYGPGDWGAMGIWTIVWFVLVVAIIALTIWLIGRFIVSRDGATPRGDEAEEILRRRFAAGEIDAEEYERRLQVLRRGR